MNDTTVPGRVSRALEEPLPGIEQLFEDQARRIPEAVAVVFHKETVHLSYVKIEAESQQLADGLRGRGVGAEVRVGS